MAKLLIFDFDDTIVHLNVDWDAVQKSCIAIADRDHLTVDKKKYLPILANSISDTRGRKNEIDSIFKKYESLVVNVRDYHIFQGMPQLIRELKMNFTLAIASGNSTATINQILSQIGILDQFDLVIGRDLVNLNKPNPEALLLILKKLKTAGSDAIMIGDSFVDHEAAKSAGVDFILVDHSNKNVPNLILEKLK